MSSDINKNNEIYIDKVKLSEVMKRILELENRNLKTKELNNKEMSIRIKEYIKHTLSKS